MIKTIDLLYDIDQELDKLSTSSNQNIPLEDKILALNKAQIEVVLSKIGINNTYNLGFDAFRKRYEDLENIVVPHEQLELNKATPNKYIGDIEDLKYKYLLYANIFILADKGECKGRELSINIIPHSDLQVMLNNSNYAPSFLYQETIGTISSNKLEIYTDKKFIPSSAYISYIRYPDSFDYPGYIKLDGTQSTESNSNLPDYLRNKILSVAVRRLALSVGDQLGAQSAQINEQ